MQQTDNTSSGISQNLPSEHSSVLNSSVTHHQLQLQLVKSFYNWFLEIKSQLLPEFPHIVLQSTQLVQTLQQYFNFLLEHPSAPVLTSEEHTSLSVNIADIGNLLQELVNKHSHQLRADIEIFSNQEHYV